MIGPGVVGLFGLIYFSILGYACLVVFVPSMVFGLTMLTKRLRQSQAIQTPNDHTKLNKRNKRTIVGLSLLVAPFILFATSAVVFLILSYIGGGYDESKSNSALANFSTTAILYSFFIFAIILLPFIIAGVIALLTRPKSTS